MYLHHAINIVANAGDAHNHQHSPVSPEKSIWDEQIQERIIILLLQPFTDKLSMVIRTFLKISQFTDFPHTKIGWLVKNKTFKY